MPIYDQGYSRWKGAITARPVRWWPILKRGFLPVIKARRNLIFLILAWIPVLVQGVLLYGDLRTGGILRGAGLMEYGSSFFYDVLKRQGLWVLLFTVLVGSDLIAKDRRFNALQLYFSKPITQNDYITGKLGIVGSYILLVTLLPCLLLWIFAIAISTQEGYFGAVWAVPLAAAVYCGIWMGVAGLMILALSAVGQRAVYIAGAFLILYGYGPLQVVTLILKALTDWEFWGLLSIESNVSQVGAWIFRGNGPHDFHPALSLLVLVAVCVVAYRVLRAKIQPVEVVL